MHYYNHGVTISDSHMELKTKTFQVFINNVVIKFDLGLHSSSFLIYLFIYFFLLYFLFYYMYKKINIIFILITNI